MACLPNESDQGIKITDYLSSKNVGISTCVNTVLPVLDYQPVQAMGLSCQNKHTVHQSSAGISVIDVK